MGDDSELPSTKDVLGEHLFTKVCLTEPKRAEQITGVLLGASNDVILHMLQDKPFLTSQITGVKRVLGECSNNHGRGRLPSGNGNHDDRLGEELFERVKKVEPHLTAKVTGMIMELDSDTIKFLLKSPDDLKEAVARAIRTLNESKQKPEAISPEIGEELYTLVEQKHPESAAAITGMLLEMDASSLQKLLQESELLDHKIEEALHVLKPT